ncbi:hypothetical protein SNE40_018192 [Patella caerulea]|uniref:Uncharacterized protein n=1 Tax=Patella caerulea TaxID=87958 RepID=A0AAN8J9Z6_PATCE
MTVTHAAVCANYQQPDVPTVSTQEEADRLMILHAVDAVKQGFRIAFYSQDTDVLLLALRRVPLLGGNPVIIVGRGTERHILHLREVYKLLGCEKASAIPNFHSLTGCDTTGHTLGLSNQAAMDAFMTTDAATISAICSLDEGDIP